MSVLTVAAAPQSDVESWPSESVGSGPGEGNAESGPQTETADVRQQVLGLKRKLEEAASEFGRLQSSLASQQQLEQLLRQGRIHLQDLRSRLQQITAERDRLETELRDHKVAHQREVDRLQTQMDALQQQLQKTTAERDHLATELAEREAAHKQFAEERAEERFTFERLLAEATANQRDMVQELDEQRQQIQTLREASMRAQSLARQIMRAHETVPLENRKS